MMAGKPSKWSTDVTINSMEEDEWMGPEDSMMALDRWQTRQHFEHNEIECKEGKKYQAIVDNQNRLREFSEDPNPRGKTFRKVRGD
jgi:hypothetical protein